MTRAPHEPDSTNPVLAAFVAQARACLGIARVVLFGSRARGDAHARSDYDFAVTAPQLSALERAAFAARWQETKPTLLATDIVWLDEAANGALGERIRTEGVEIYVR